MDSVHVVLALVALATVVAAVAGRLSAPAPSLLVLAGLAVGSVPGISPIQPPPGLVSLVVLPPLLYAAGHNLSVRDLRALWRPVTLLAVGLVVATATLVAYVCTALTDVPFAVAFVLGAVLASTDPVAVTALARTLRLPSRLETLVSAESLFNDATSLVLFQVAVGVVAADAGVHWGAAGVRTLVLGGGGVLVGLAAAAGAVAVRRRTHDPVLETVLTLVTPYAVFAAAEVVHVSGVTAVVVTGVVLGAVDQHLTSAFNRLQLVAVTDTVVFLLESVVFALIGLQLPALVRTLDLPAATWVVPTLVVTAAVVVMRAVWVFPLTVVVQRRAREPVSWRAPAVATWAGTRGVVPLAAALSIPLVLDDGTPFPYRDLLLVMAIGVVVLTLVVQGLTLRPLTDVSGVAEPLDVTWREEATAERALADAALERAQELMDAGLAPSAALTRLVDDLTDRRDQAALRLRLLGEGAGSPTAGAAEAGLDHLEVRRELLVAERAALARLLADGVVGETTWRGLQHALDLREAALGRQDR